MFRTRLGFARLFGLLLMATYCLCTPANAFQEKADAKVGLPTTEEVIERHILARGGFEILSSISTLRTVWNKEDSTGSWRYERWRTPGRKYAQRSLDGEVNQLIGCWVANPSADVKSLKGVGWSQFGGNTIIESHLELQENLVDTATIAEATHWLERHKSIVVKGVEKIGGSDCFLLEFTNVNDEVAKRYFDCKTYQKVCVIQVEHDTGGQSVTRYYSDFKEFNGIVIPMKQKIVSRRGTDLWEVEEFEHDGEFDIEELHTPDAVLDLIARMEAEMQSVSEKLAEK